MQRCHIEQYKTEGDMMGYKEGCGFREKVNVCKFREEDCNPEKCDMFNIKFTSKDIMKTTKIERKNVIDLTKQMKDVKKKDREKYLELKELRKDKVIGMVKLSKAYMYCKRTGK